METDTEILRKRLKSIEAHYPMLEASISELNAKIAQSPYSQSLKAQWRNQKAKLTEGKTEAEELRIQLGLPIEEEDPNKPV